MSAAGSGAAPGLGRLAKQDRLAETLGIEFIAAGEGSATLALTVGPRHLNFLGRGHGGLIFALADAAFGLASNSHGVIAVGIDAHIAYASPVSEGDRLIARAAEISRSSKVAVYRVAVEQADGTLVANFTGTVYVTGRVHD